MNMVCQPYAPAALPPGIIPGTRFCYALNQPQGRSVAGRIMSMKNSNDRSGNRARDLTSTNCANTCPTGPTLLAENV
jgi:hypothetical protein